MYFVYIIRCCGDKLYTGITTDIKRRMNEHFRQTEKCAKFTRSHKAEALEALWSTKNRSLASKLEWNIKHLTRAQKLALIRNNALFTEFFDSDAAESYQRESVGKFLPELRINCTQNE